MAQKLVYAQSLAGLKKAYNNWSTSTSDIYYSIVYTADGYIVTHGKIMKAPLLSSIDSPGDLSASYDSSNKTIIIKDHNGSEIFNQALPDISGDGMVDAKYENGAYKVSHATLENKTTDTEVSTTQSAGALKFVTGVTFDKYGHVKSVDTNTAAINAEVVKQNASTTSSAGRLLLDGNNKDTEYTGAVNKSQITITSGKNLSNVGTISAGDITSTGTVKGSTIKIGEDALTANYAYKSGKGYVQLTDSYKNSDETAAAHATPTSASTSTASYAATPQAVYDAWVSAKSYADEKLSESMGTVAGAFVFKKSVATFSDLPALSSTTAGEVYVVTGNGFSIDKTYTFTGVAETVESGDMIIATGTSSTDKKWSVIQRNVSGAVTADNNFTANYLIFGAGSNKSVASKAFDAGHFSVSSGSFQLATLSNTSSTDSDITGNNYTSNLTLEIPTINYDTYGRIKGVNIKKYSVGAQNHLAAASKSTLGGINLLTDTQITSSSSSFTYATTDSSSSTGVSGRVYAVQLNSSNQALVSVPWVEYTQGNGLTFGAGTTSKSIAVKAADNSIDVSTSGVKVNVSTGLSLDTTAGIKLNNASNSAIGGIKLAITATETTKSITSYAADKLTENRLYAVQTKTDGTAFVNVPWTDYNDNTTYTLFVGASNSTSNAAATNGNVYLHFKPSTGAETTKLITGSGATSVTSDANGNITISSTNSWRDIHAYNASHTTSSSIFDQSYDSIGALPLKFGKDFCWNGSEMNICWAEISSDGTVTYK